MELTEYDLADSLLTLGEAWRGRAPRTKCPEDFMLLLSISLFVALEVTMSLKISELYENSKGISNPSLGTKKTVIDFFQALLLEQINDT